jgi:hypothetical protein
MVRYTNTLAQHTTYLNNDCVCNIIHVVFEDKRLSAGILMVWLSVVLYTFSHLGLFKTHFMSFGPSSETYFMGVVLDTWPKWAHVAIFTFISTAVNDFVGDSLVPFITNTIQDHKNKYLPYSKITCWAITQTLSIYSCSMSIFSIYLLLSQLDFMFIRMFADSLVNMYTMHRFMKNKKVSRSRYTKWNEADTAETDSDSGGSDNMTEIVVDDMKDTKDMKPEDTNKNTMTEVTNDSTVSRKLQPVTKEKEPQVGKEEEERIKETWKREEEVWKGEEETWSNENEMIEHTPPHATTKSLLLNFTVHARNKMRQIIHRYKERNNERITTTGSRANSEECRSTLIDIDSTRGHRDYVPSPLSL